MALFLEAATRTTVLKRAIRTPFLMVELLELGMVLVGLVVGVFRREKNFWLGAAGGWSVGFFCWFTWLGKK
jgi:hypothetical protein